MEEGDDAILVAEGYIEGFFPDAQAPSEAFGIPCAGSKEFHCREVRLREGSSGICRSEAETDIGVSGAADFHVHEKLLWEA